MSQLQQTIYTKIKDDAMQQKKKIAVLVDPDKFNPYLIEMADQCHVDYFFAGGSILTNGNLEECIKAIKKISTKPVVIFPGDNTQICNKADALLLLSLVSGRNPEYLIGQHVSASIKLKKSGLEIIPTGYLLIDGENVSATAYKTQTMPLPSNNPKIAIATALAAEQLGMKLIYLEAGSGAAKCIPAATIAEVKKMITLPLIVGGGIDSPEKAIECFRAGADIIVIGNVLEKYPSLIKTITATVNSLSFI